MPWNQGAACTARCHGSFMYSRQGGRALGAWPAARLWTRLAGARRDPRRHPTGQRAGAIVRRRLGPGQAGQNWVQIGCPGCLLSEVGPSFLFCLLYRHGSAQGVHLATMPEPRRDRAPARGGNVTSRTEPRLAGGAAELHDAADRVVSGPTAQGPALPRARS